MSLTNRPKFFTLVKQSKFSYHYSSRLQNQSNQLHFKIPVPRGPLKVIHLRDIKVMGKIQRKVTEVHVVQTNGICHGRPSPLPAWSSLEIDIYNYTSLSTRLRVPLASSSHIFAMETGIIGNTVKTCLFSCYLCAEYVYIKVCIHKTKFSFEKKCMHRKELGTFQKEKSRHLWY